ncbi:MAG TPA: hypothetical protein VJA21_34475 [Verrucomicrobiae bacterium]
MALSGIARRRIVGAGVLGAALLMLILGQTVLRETLSGVGFLIYWLACLALTGLAIAVALADARATGIELRRQNRELIDQTVKGIQEKAIEKKNQRQNGPQ